MTPQPAFKIPTSVHHMLFVGILITAVFPRFNNICNQGIEVYDEAHLMLETRFIVSACNVLIRKVFEVNSDETVNDVFAKGIPPSFAKPLFNLSLMPSFVVGPGPQYAGPVVSAVFSMVTILVMYCIGRMFWGPIGGLVAMALTNMSGYQLFFARYGTAESAGMAMLLMCAVLSSPHVGGR
jgi:hypothetical protein